MTWLIVVRSIGGERERVLGAVDAANIEDARRRAQRLFPNREWVLRESERRPARILKPQKR
jgi:hypothetical protein